MYRNDKITYCEEIKKAGNLKPENGSFYLFLAPKSGEAQLALLIGKLIDNTTETTIPVVPNEWNPMVFKEVNITSDTLSKYKVFIGME